MHSVEIQQIPGDEFYQYGDPHPDAYLVRKRVFIDEQDVPEAIELDGHDRDAIHFVAYEGDAPVGTARLRFIDDETAKPERVAVRQSYRGRGIGTALMDAVETEALDRGSTRAFIHAQTAVQEFYAARGYEPRGDTFEEAGIPHIEMVKELA